MWAVEMVSILRYLINDLDECPKYSDDRLSELLLVAAMTVNNDIGGGYSVNISKYQIAPDPTCGANRNEALITLIALKAACVLARGEAKLAGGKGVAWRQGSSSADTRGVASNAQASSANYCSDYEAARWNYQVGNRSAGCGILGPVGLGWTARYGDCRERVGF